MFCTGSLPPFPSLSLSISLSSPFPFPFPLRPLLSISPPSLTNEKFTQVAFLSVLFQTALGMILLSIGN